MFKQDTYNGIIFSHKEEWNTDIRNNMQKHYARWEKPAQKDTMWCNSIHMKFP